MDFMLSAPSSFLMAVACLLAPNRLLKRCFYVSHWRGGFRASPLGWVIGFLFWILPGTVDGVEDRFQWEKLPDLPDSLGVAGPFVGVHNDALIVAGGANFPKPYWESEKKWHDRIYVLSQSDADANWIEAGSLPLPTAYGAAISTPLGVLCMGGNDAENVFKSVYLLRWNPAAKSIDRVDLADLPTPCVYGAAAISGSRVYLFGGQSSSDLDSATDQIWYLDLPKQPGEQLANVKSLTWQKIDQPFPGKDRAFPILVTQHNGFNDCLYLMSGRRQGETDVEFLKDVWEFDLIKRSWRQRASLPRCVMAGTGVDLGQSHVLVMGGADGANFKKTNLLKDNHPGFPKEALLYHTITDTWTSGGKTPANQVTTRAVKWGDSIIVPSGEVRPRVRSPAVWQIKQVPRMKENEFGFINYLVLVVYLAGIVGVGFWFSRRNNNTDQYFRGGKSIPWWAAGCSIFATMLSSLTYTGVPAKSYAQDWVYSVGNLMIPLVAILAVYVALPFFRRLDATSAYEYLEYRFNRWVRLFGSGSFALFHVFRMAVVMSLTGLALAVATPLTPVQSVLLMGALSMLYCTLGGIEAVIWTDTIQTVVLLGGAIVAVFLLISGVDSGWQGFLSSAADSEKFRWANFHWDATDSQIALWVIIAGGLAQNVSSYTADQAVVQRYMTTSDQKLAARSIWTNAILVIPATLLFFGIGTALFVFYQNHPERLDPSITTDQIFPMFIAREMPVGLAGLLVAGIFAAAQSTVSTSMNSTATTVVTDFLRPLSMFQSDRGYLVAAKVLTLLIGLAGTVLALLFVNPDIKSLFDEFIKVIGLFMGVLGGLFVLGVMTKRANGSGALIGGIVGAISMFIMWKFTSVNGYLYTAAGISICFVVGYCASLGCPHDAKSLNRVKDLTIYRDANV